MISKKAEIAIGTKELTHDYGSFRAVDSLSFQVAAGTIFGLLGPNGAGKSTTIKMLTTLLPVTSGTATISGFDLVEQPNAVRSQIGYVSQLISADGSLTAYENLLLSSKLYGLGKACREERIKEILDFLELSAHAHQLVNQFSGGMIRRLEIGQALIHQPRVLFLDEPTVGLDPAAKKNVWQHIKEWRKTFGTTILLTTHDMNEADKLCDNLAFMYQGRIAAIDTPANLKAELGAKATFS